MVPMFVVVNVKSTTQGTCQAHDDPIIQNMEGLACVETVRYELPQAEPV